MKITKLGHCALVLEIDGVKVLTDPGSFTTDAQEAQTGINIVLITHEHQDHFHAESVRKILEANPGAIVVSNSAVAALIQKEAIGTVVSVVGDGQALDVNGVHIEGFGKLHAEVYGEMGQCENTGYLVANKFYFPGDNFHNPGKTIDVLALPVAGPWMRIKDCIDFAKEVKARTAFGVHDGMIQPFFRGFVGQALKMFVPGTEYVAMEDGETRDF